MYNGNKISVVCLFKCSGLNLNEVKPTAIYYSKETYNWVWENTQNTESKDTFILKYKTHLLRKFTLCSFDRRMREISNKRFFYLYFYSTFEIWGVELRVLFLNKLPHKSVKLKSCWEN